MRDAVAFRRRYLRSFNQIGYVKAGNKSCPCQIFETSVAGATLVSKNGLNYPTSSLFIWVLTEGSSGTVR
jgi:hypothetical protein